ncbi:PTS system ascorbate-specific IIB component [Aequitasia blattaphilus]|uniref:PTS sugar transporter subunit IIB n=1 Tax=Aequitasia blattaphilus TaxID=2949332 RepID=A0ABT1EAW7_9FIRM|nr:PTS sugar transporter subunit IIB [Aequitasia blattaphilus]MCP1102975.1 PTS sugar transporter subunit IIB [Aequitasia blattaphilus]MCR8615615.1 PTS sugar transporter subunit IIB [Aequitasia blattaphilus]
MAKENMSILVCCANGAGSSLMMKMTMQKVLDKVGLKPGKIHHCALSEGKSAASQYDVVFCAQNFCNMFKDAAARGTTVIGLRNIMSPKEIEDKMKEHGIID